MRRMLWLVGLLVLVLPTPVQADPIGFSVRSNQDDHLYSIDLSTGVTIDLGLANLNDAEGLSFVGSTLYAIGGTVDEFWDITTPPGALVGATGSRTGIDAGLAYDSTSATMYHTSPCAVASPVCASTNTTLYSVTLGTGAVSAIGNDGSV